MATTTVQPGQIKSGPGVIKWANIGTALPTFATPTASKLIPTWVAGWLDIGATDAGLTYTESTETADITVVESLYRIRQVETGKSGTVAFAMAHISDVNWSLAATGGQITVTGTGATKMTVYVPPLVGQSKQVMLGFQSLDDEEVIVWPQCFNAAGFETTRGAYDTIALLPVSFAVDLPDPAVLTTPYKRWTAGSLAQGV